MENTPTKRAWACHKLPKKINYDALARHPQPKFSTHTVQSVLGMVLGLTEPRHHQRVRSCAIPAGTCTFSRTKQSSCHPENQHESGTTYSGRCMDSSSNMDVLMSQLFCGENIPARNTLESGMFNMHPKLASTAL